MKKSLVLFMALALALAFAVPATAADVKFSGSYYAQGWYASNPSLVDPNSPGASTIPKANQYGAAYIGAVSDYSQRFRLGMEFKVAEGLYLFTRFDAMERVWADDVNAAGNGSINVASGERSMRWEIAYLTYTSPIGQWRVGYMISGVWGTVFGDTTEYYPSITYILPVKNWAFIAKVEKRGEDSPNPNTPAKAAAPAAGPGNDRDHDRYYLAVNYDGDKVDWGILYRYIRNAAGRVLENPLMDDGVARFHTLNPYIIAQLGPVKLQGELGWVTGKMPSLKPGFAVPTSTDVTSWGVGIFADATFGPVAVGLTGAWAQGDDPSTKDTIEGYGIDGGEDYNPTLILWNSNTFYTKFVGQNRGFVTSANSGYTPYEPAKITNAWLFQLRAGVNPTAKLNIAASWTWAKADKTPTNFIGDAYGNEVDLTATYKLMDNLSYMVGLGYFMPGDYFKATNASAELQSNYLLTHKLTFTF